MSLNKNDYIELEINGMTSEGNGVGRYEGLAVFVPNTAVGDVIKAKIVKAAKSYAFGRLEEITTPSSSRIQPDCSNSVQCGGCVYRHIKYSEELKIKEQKVRDSITRISGLSDVEILPIVGADCPDRYRNKAQLPVRTSKDGEIEIGFFAARSHRVIDCTECMLQPQEFSNIIKIFKNFLESSKNEPYDETTHKGRVRHLYIRKGEMSGEIMVCVVVNGNGLYDEDVLVKELTRQIPAIKSIVININREKTNVIMGKKCRTIYGKGYITDTLCGLEFKISPLSFYQINRSQAERLYNIAADYAGLNGGETLLDLYCGTGTIGLSMAKRAKKLIGVEIIEQAVEDAKINAVNNKIENTEFICSDAAEAAEILRKRGEKSDVIVLDPPRKGCSPELIETINKMSPDRVVYVSCDPATLARDLKIFDEKGYKALNVTPVDMFPRTAHVESVCLLTKNKKEW